MIKRFAMLGAAGFMALGLAACGDDDKTVVVNPQPQPAPSNTTVVNPPPASSGSTVVVPNR